MTITPEGLLTWAAWLDADADSPLPRPIPFPFPSMVDMLRAHAAALEELAAYKDAAEKRTEERDHAMLREDTLYFEVLEYVESGKAPEKASRAISIVYALKRKDKAALEELAALTIDRDNYAAKYAAMRERAERAEAELARLKTENASLAAQLANRNNQIAELTERCKVLDQLRVDANAEWGRELAAAEAEIVKALAQRNDESRLRQETEKRLSEARAEIAELRAGRKP